MAMMHLFSLEFVFTVLGATLIMGIGCNAVQINITPDRCISTMQTTIDISCVADGGHNNDNEITLMKIYRNDEEPMVVLRHCSNITYGVDSSRMIQAEGYIGTDSGQRFLNVTVLNPKSEDTGIYTCVMYYVDRTWSSKEEKASATLTVEKLDVMSLEVVLTQLKDNLVTCKKEIDELKEKESSVTERVTVVEREVKDLLPQLDSSVSVLVELTEKVTFTSAFAVTNRGAFRDPGNGHVIVFPDVLMSQGPGYDVSTGVYTAPKDGLYTFHVAIRPSGGCGFDLDLKANKEILVRLRCNTNVGEQTSVSSVTNLTVGDQVYLLVTNGGCNLNYAQYTIFTGYLIHAF